MTDNRRISPHATRVTFTGPDLGQLVVSAPDQRVKLFIPRSGTTAPPIAPGAATAREALERIPEDRRPYPRTYTIRAFRGEPPRMDVDFALREPGGPASQWARHARAGQSLEMLGPIAQLNRGFLFRPPPNRHILLVGDQSALPAVGSIVESLPADARGHAFLTVPADADRQNLAVPRNMHVTWLREGDHRGVLAGIRAADLPAGKTYAWLAGSASAVTEQRRHLLDERGLAPREIASMAYWNTNDTRTAPQKSGAEHRRDATLTATMTAGMPPVATPTIAAARDTRLPGGPHLPPDLHMHTGFRRPRRGPEMSYRKALQF